MKEYEKGQSPIVFNAMQSSYTSMTAAGTFNGWSPSATNMHLVDHYIWQTTVSINLAGNTEFKFAANGNWNVNWGENNQSDFTVDSAGFAEQTGGNIRMNGPLNGTYVIKFNEVTKDYEFKTQ